MKVKVSMDLRQAERYINLLRSGRVKQEGLSQIAASIKRYLWKFIFTNIRSQIFDVPDAATMRSLISTNSYPPLAHYNPWYLNMMFRKNLLPHGSIRNNTYIDIINKKVLFYIPMMNTVKTSLSYSRVFTNVLSRASTIVPKAHVYNIGPIQERRKSILKATIVFAWKDIITKVTNIYKRNAERI